LFYINTHRHAVNIGLWRVGDSGFIRTRDHTNDIACYRNPWAKLTHDTIISGSTSQI
jgi:hypothetical protein